MITQGSSDNFAALYKRFRVPIFKYVSARITDEQIAEEVTQDIFVKVFRFEDQYDNTKEFSTWLWTIARNTVVDVLRRKTEQRAEESDILAMLDESENAEVALVRKDIRRKLWVMMKPLSRTQRRVMWMSAVQQCSHAEISKTLGLSVAAIKNVVYRCRLSLNERNI